MTSTHRQHLRNWAPHIACCLVALACFVIASVRHMSTEDARARALDPNAPASERLWAAHIACERARTKDRVLGDDLVRAFCVAPDPRLAEFTMTTGLTKHSQGAKTEPPPLQIEYLTTAFDPEVWTQHRLLTTLFYLRKGGGSRLGNVERLDLDEAGWAFHLLATGEIPPRSLLDEHFVYRGNRYEEIRASRKR